MELDDADVRAILQLLDASAFDELQVQTDRFKLTLRRAEGAAWTRETRTLGTPRELPAAQADPGATTPGAPCAPGAPGASTGSATLAAPAATRGATAAAQTAQTDQNASAVPGASDARDPAQAPLVAVHSPLPGTFYRSPKPGAPPFVAEGSRVESYTVVAIVETMKLMNSVYAGATGRVAEICVADAAAVTPESVLMRIEPSPA